MATDFQLSSIENPRLEVGTTYTLTLRVTSDSQQHYAEDLSFTTPGGCPSNVAPPPRADNLSPSAQIVTDEDGYFVRRIMQGGATWSPRVRPAYRSAYKTWPTTSDYQYLATVDDWALHLDATNIGKAEILQRTIFEECAPEEVKMLVEVRTNPLDGAQTESSCRLVEGEVIVDRVGFCTLRVVISNSTGVSKSSKQSSLTRDLYYFVNKSTTSSRLTTTTSPTLQILNKKTLSLSHLITKIGLSPKKKYSVTLIGRASTSPCAVTRVAVQARRKGTCTVKVSRRVGNSRVQIGIYKIRIR